MAQNNPGNYDLHEIVDTNVLLVANRMHPEASIECVSDCGERLQKIKDSGILVLDDKWIILDEHGHKLNSKGQPGIGDAFYKWALSNWKNPNHCYQVSITEISTDNYQEFPQDPALVNFDLSDRKFVAVALAHPARPPILNASDTDWKTHETALSRHGIKIDFICPELMKQTKKKRK